MRYLALVVLISVFATANSQIASPGFLLVKNFTTLLDHFNPQNFLEVNFTYSSNENFFRTNGPIYIFIQDNRVLTTDLLKTGIMHDLAEDTGAVLVTASNRFFRENLPTPNASVTNLQFLTVDQILADIPYLIKAVRNNLLASEKSKVILFGSGLGATLAGWACQMYPHLIAGVWSSSGVYQREVHSAVPFEELSAAIGRIGGSQCTADMGEAFESIALLIQRQANRLMDDFRLCYAIEYWNDYDLASFYFGINQVLINQIDVNNNVAIENMCNALLNKNTTSVTPELNAYAEWFRSIFTSDFCLEVKFSFRVVEASVDNWPFIHFYNWQFADSQSFPFPSRPSLWLVCTQLGGWATSVNSQSLFQHDIGQDTFFRFCQAAFDDYDYAHLEGSVASINRRFGGNNPAISNAIFVNAGLDPWSSFGVREEQSTNDTYVFNLDGYGKSADLFSIRSENSPQLIEVKQKIAAIVTEWGHI